MSNSTAEAVEALAVEEQTAISHVHAGAAGAMVRHEVEAQLDAAHRYPRSMTRFLHRATSMATISEEVAESCIYSLPRGGKMITGPSVRLAEICASAYGNLQVAARVVDAEEREVVAQGACWDMETNLRCTVEVRRRITNRHGKRYDDDMITITGNAAASIALRNAIFRVVPRAYVDTVYNKARAVAVGNAKTLASKRDQVLARLGALGVTPDRVFARLECTGPDDIGLAHMETLIGLGTAIKDGSMTIEDAFPAPPPAPVPPEQDGKRIKMGRGKTAAKSEPQAATPPEREPGDDSDEPD